MYDKLTNSKLQQDIRSFTNMKDRISMLHKTPSLHKPSGPCRIMGKSQSRDFQKINTKIFPKWSFLLKVAILGPKHETSNDLIPKMRPKFVAKVWWIGQWLGAQKQLVCLWRMYLMFSHPRYFWAFLPGYQIRRIWSRRKLAEQVNPQISRIFLLDPFYRRGRVYKRKFCLCVCP